MCLPNTQCSPPKTTTTKKHPLAGEKLPLGQNKIRKVELETKTTQNLGMSSKRLLLFLCWFYVMTQAKHKWRLMLGDWSKKAKENSSVLREKSKCYFCLPAFLMHEQFCGWKQGGKEHVGWWTPRRSGQVTSACLRCRRAAKSSQGRRRG